MTNYYLRKDYLNSRLATSQRDWRHCCVSVLSSSISWQNNVTTTLCMTSVAAQQPTHIITPSSIELTESFLIDSVSPKLGYSPHKWQAHIARTLLLRKNRIIVSVAATGSGKSLTFWLPILAGEPGITFIVVPLTVLGQQMADSAGGLGISAFNATSITMRSEYAIKVQLVQSRWCSDTDVPYRIFPRADIKSSPYPPNFSSTPGSGTFLGRPYFANLSLV